MNNRYKYWEFEPLKEKPLVRGRAIFAAGVSVVIVAALVSLVVWLTGRV